MFLSCFDLHVSCIMFIVVLLCIKSIHEVVIKLFLQLFPAPKTGVFETKQKHLLLECDFEREV